MNDRGWTREPGLPEFARVVAIGLGRAILHLQTHEATPYRAAILDACLHSTVYDAQAEPTRERYLLDLIDLTGERDFYRTQILAALPRVQDTADAEQLFALARSFAARGDAEARRRLYETFAANAATERPDGAPHLVEVDGVAGLLAVAARLPLEREDFWYARYLTDLVAERQGEEATAAALTEAAANDPRIAAFAAAVEEERARDRARAARRRRHTATRYDHIRQLLADDPRAGSMLLRWGRTASAGDLARAAADLLAEEDPRRLRAYLRLFCFHPFPLDHTRLLTLARDPDPLTRAPAIGALAASAHPEVRALGLELLAAGRGRGARLLVGNYRQGDYGLVERALRAWQDRDEVHDLGLALLDLVEAHPAPEAVAPLLLLYERGPCSLCRRWGIDLLQKLGPLPGWLVAEGRHDAHPDLRAAMRRYHGVDRPHDEPG